MINMLALSCLHLQDSYLIFPATSVRSPHYPNINIIWCAAYYHYTDGVVPPCMSGWSGGIILAFIIAHHTRKHSFTGDNPPIDNEWNIQICLQLSRTHCLLNIKLKWFPIKEKFLIPSGSWKVNRKNWLSCRCWCCWQWVANYRLVRYLYSLFINLLDIENNL